MATSSDSVTQWNDKFSSLLPITDVKDMTLEEYAMNVRNMMEEMAIIMEDDLPDSDFVFYMFNTYDPDIIVDAVFAAKTELGAFFIFLEQARKEGITGINPSTYEGLVEVNWDSADEITPRIIMDSVNDMLYETFGLDVKIIGGPSIVDSEDRVYYFRTSPEIKSARKLL